MVIFKKLIFAPFFLLVFSLLIYHLAPLLSSYDFIFSLSATTLIQLVNISLLIVISSLLFVLSAALAANWRITVPIILISAVIPLLFIPPVLALILAVTILASLFLSCLSLDNTLKSYLDFKPTKLLGPVIRNLSGLLILSFCLVYFLSTSTIVAQKGFQIPDSLIDTALKMSPTSIPTEQTLSTQPTINSEQITLLKQNPELLKQYGLSSGMLDSLSNPQNLIQTTAQLSNDLIKQTVKEQMQGFIKPYLQFIPIILAVMLFVTLQSFISLVSLFITPVLWLIFLILEKTGYIKFEIEQRQVRKMVI